MKAVFDEAVELDPSVREGFLSDQTTNDPQLAEEVRKLLLYHDLAGDFLEMPAFSPADDQPERRLGPYLIDREIGRGGMSVVYLGHRADGEFKKQVAIKVLRAGIYGDDVRERFLRERQILADLNHPSIVRLWDGGVLADGRPYLVQDYVDGVPLTEHVRAAKLPMRARIELFLSLLDAVAYAHSRGVIHRDIKPSNVLVNSHGAVMLLDFGIAKIHAESGADPTVTQSRVLTPAYCSPEQACGEPVTAASDIYSLGLLLTELLRDRQARKPGAPPDAIVDTSALPMRLARIVDRACHREPARRYQDAASLADDLGAFVQRGPARFLRRITAGRALRIPLFKIAAAAALLMSLWLAFRPANPYPPQVRIALTGNSNLEDAPNLSPDGRFLVYEDRTPGNRGLHVRSLQDGTSRRLTRPSGADLHPKFSPDGTQILFARGTSLGDQLDLITVPAGGGPERLILRRNGPQFRSYRHRDWAIWGPKGSSILYLDAASPAHPFTINNLDLNSGARKPVTKASDTAPGVSCMAVSPDGTRIAFVHRSSGYESNLYVSGLDGRHTVRLTRQSTSIYGVSWTPDSREIVFASNFRLPSFTLWRVAASGEQEARPIPGAEGNSTWPSAAPSPNGGSRVAYILSHEPVNIHRWDDFESGSKAPLSLAPSNSKDTSAQYSPDGKRLAFSSNRLGFHEIWIANADGTGLRQVTQMNGPHTDSPRWSPDSKQLTFTSADDDNRDVYLADVNSGAIRRLTTDATDEGRASWSGDGKWLYFRSNRSGSHQIWKMAVADGGSKPVQLTSKGGWEGFESTDGRWLYFAKPRPALGIWRIPVSGGAEELVSSGPIREGLWALAGSSIYFIKLNPLGELWRVAPALPPERLGRINVPVGGIWSGFSVRHDGKSVLFSQTASIVNDLMLLDRWR